MERLDKNWLTEGLIDFEYKKYILLAYLKNIRQNFRVNKLYPYLSDLINHYSNLKNLQKDKLDLASQFPKILKTDELLSYKLTFERLIKDDSISQELEDIMIYAIDEMLGTMKAGKEIYELVEGSMEIIPIGLTSLYRNEGYMLIDHTKSSDIKIFRYQITVFEGPTDTHRAIHTTFVDSIKKGISTTYEHVRLMLVRKNRDISNPATYLINSKYTFPLEETVLPVAKRLLVRHVNVA